MDYALQSMNTLLGPGGWLYVVDPTNAPMFADVIFGCLGIQNHGHII